MKIHRKAAKKSKAKCEIIKANRLLLKTIDKPLNRIGEGTKKKFKFTQKKEPVRKQKDDTVDASDALSEDDPIFHFKGILNEDGVEQLCEIDNWSRSEHAYEYMGRSFVETPFLNIKETPPVPSIEACPYIYPVPSAGTFTDLTSSFDIQKYVKEHLVAGIPASNGFSSTDNIGLTPLQNELLSVIGRYADLYYTEAKPEHLEEIRFAYCLHVLNHLSKCRYQIVHNNAVLEGKEYTFNKNREPYRDQGFTRPKVLILAPFKNTAYKLVKTILSILSEKDGAIRHLKKFEEDYGPEAEAKIDRLNRPADYQATFEGDTKENFKIGIKLSKGSVKLYSEYYQSDLIIASPLGLRLSIGSQKTQNLNTDFLNSMEIVILDQADAMLMQNWDNVLMVIDHLNLSLKDPANATNVPRTREWNVRGFASYYRQTIVLSSFLDIYQRNIYMKSRNFAGRVEVIHQITEGSIEEIGVKSELNIWLFEDSDPEIRRKYFISHILPSLAKLKQVMLYIPDYYDYILLVHYLHTNGGIAFSTLNEYMINEAAGKMSEARSAFYEGRRNMIVMTERFHFYQRYRIKGIKNIMFYSLPSFPQFVPEVCNWLADEYQNPHLEMEKKTPIISLLFDERTISNMCHLIGTQKTQKIWNTKKKFSTLSIHGND